MKQLIVNKCFNQVIQSRGNRVINFSLIFLIVIFNVTCKKVVRDYYENGQLMSEYQVLFIDKGKPDGYYKIFNSDGTLIFNGNYKSGELDGISVSYYDNGNLKFKLENKEGKLWNIVEYLDVEGNKLKFGDLSDGKGYVKIFDDSGDLKSEGPVRNGIKYGEWVFYNRYTKRLKNFPSNSELNNKIFL